MCTTGHVDYVWTTTTLMYVCMFVLGTPLVIDAVDTVDTVVKFIHY